MQWQKLGLVWAPNGEAEWACTHATLPVAQSLDDGRWWIYVSTRDASGKSRIARLTVDAAPLADDRPPRVLEVDPQPVLSLGAPGTFDDSGVMPSWLVGHGDELWLYYIGWNVIATVPYRLSIGLAISRDGGRTFERYAQGPVIDRSRHEPYFATAPCVLCEGARWRMWYVSCTGWETVLSRWEPCYHVKYAESANGVDWTITGASCIEAAAGDAVGRPCVFRRNGNYEMLYSYRSITNYRSIPGQGYRLGYADSADGVRWRRADDHAGLGRSCDGWDSQMLAYCWVQRQGAHTYLLYNGNGFGASGFGLARLASEDEGATSSTCSTAGDQTPTCVKM
jgi:hypothetical protein